MLFLFLCCSVAMSDSLGPHGLQHTRLPCPSPSSGVCSNSWVHWVVMPSNHFILCTSLLFLPLIFPSIRVFSSESALCIRWPKYQSFSINPSNEYSGLISFRIHWLDLLCCPRDSHESSPAPQFKSINSLALSLLSSPTLTYLHDYWKNDSFDYMDFFFFCRATSLFNMLSMFVIAFLPRGKHLLISWLQSPSTVVLEPNKICHCFHFFPSICHEVMRLEVMILVFLMLSFKQASSLISFTLIKRLFSFWSTTSEMHVLYLH